MPYINPNLDKLNWAHTYALGIADLNVPQLQNEVMRPVLDAFHSNAMRLKWMMLAPAFTGDLANRIQRYTDIAEFEITGTLSKGRQAPDDHGQEIFDRMRALLSEDTDQVTAAAQTSDDATKAVVQEAVETGGSYAVLLSSASPGARGFEALLMSYVSGMWTIFETLASDAWEAAVNAKPDRLAQLKGKSNRLKKGKASRPPAQATADDAPGKQIKLEFLQFYGWNLTDRMGTVLRNKYDFARLDGIREAYASAFAEKNTDIDNALKDDAIDILSTLRNAIVHRGGVADKEYLQRRKYLPGLPDAADGQVIPLDGKVVSHAIGETLFCCVTLIGAIDDWIASN
jgi:hypothetical protein